MPTFQKNILPLLSGLIMQMETAGCTEMLVSMSEITESNQKITVQGCTVNMLPLYFGR
jgi:hypothetical protein